MGEARAKRHAESSQHAAFNHVGPPENQGNRSQQISQMSHRKTVLRNDLTLTHCRLLAFQFVKKRERFSFAPWERIQRVFLVLKGSLLNDFTVTHHDVVAGNNRGEFHGIVKEAGVGASAHFNDTLTG